MRWLVERFGLCFQYLTIYFACHLSSLVQSCVNNS